MSESTISHPGVISKIEGSKAEVTVQVNSGCASCEIKGACTISESVAKVVEVELENDEMYYKGQLVSVEMKQSQGSYAVIFGYLFPFLVLVLSLVGSYALTYVVLAALMAVTLVETLRLPGDAASHVSS